MRKMLLVVGALIGCAACGVEAGDVCFTPAGWYEVRYVQRGGTCWAGEMLPTRGWYWSRECGNEEETRSNSGMEAQLVVEGTADGYSGTMRFWPQLDDGVCYLDYDLIFVRTAPEL